MFAKFRQDFYDNFIKFDRWLTLVDGLGLTLLITFCALLVGVTIGIVVAAVRSTHDKNLAELRLRNPALAWVLIICDRICRVYLTIFRGTPVVVQLMIFYYFIFSSVDNGMLVAIVAFGINSGAYVAEIFRGGIMAINQGQFEAGRSLGFNYLQTMRHIIIPQTFKATLPTLCNEFIMLLKETSVAGYVAIIELTGAGDKIRGSTYSLLPLLAVALIYLVLVIILTKLVSLLERRLRKSER